MGSKRSVARIAAILGLAVLALATTGCFLRGPGDVKREVSALSSLDLDRELGLRFGRFSMFLAKQGLKIAGEDGASLRGLRKVEVGIYRVDPQPARYAAFTDRNGDPSLCALDFPDWELVVRVCDEGEHVLLFAKEREAGIRGLLVVTQDSEEVVIVRARGKLDLLLRDVMDLGGEEARFPWSRADAEIDMDDDESPEPMIAVCEDDVVDGPCADRDEARRRVLHVAAVLNPAEDEAAP